MRWLAGASASTEGSPCQGIARKERERDRWNGDWISSRDTAVTHVEICRTCGCMRTRKEKERKRERERERENGTATGWQAHHH